MSRRKFICMDCKVDTGRIFEYYFINTQTWLSVTSSKKGMLCISCLERRLGRELNSTDFTDCTINDPKFTKMSVRLLDRIRRVDNMAQSMA